jgi:predicted Zn-dependent protease
MRVLLAAAMSAALLISQAAVAKDKSEPPKVTGATSGATLSSEQSTALGVEARRKSDAQQRAWDDKTKSITKGICSGC